MGRYDPKLLQLAEHLNDARLEANGIKATAAPAPVYGPIALALRRTLLLITDSLPVAEQAYQNLLEGGNVTAAIYHARTAA